MILGLPAIKGFSSLKWQLVGNFAIAENDLGNTFQRIERDGTHWVAALNLPKSKDDSAGVFIGWVAETAKASRSFYMSPPQAIARGNWNPAELLTNGTFRDGISGWTANLSTLSHNTRRLKVANAGAAAGDGRQNVNMEANKPHVFVVDGRLGRTAPGGYVHIVRQSDSGIEYDSNAVVFPNRIVALVTPTVSAMQVRLHVNSAVAGASVMYSGASLARCLQVNGAAQVGTRLEVDGAPANMNAALKAGEYVCFMAGTLYHLAQLTEDFDTDNTGAGALVFEPPMPASPADNAAVIVRNPFTRFVFPKPGYEADVTPPIRYGVTINVRQDITP